MIGGDYNVERVLCNTECRACELAGKPRTERAIPAGSLIASKLAKPGGSLRFCYHPACVPGVAAELHASRGLRSGWTVCRRKRGEVAITDDRSVFARVKAEHASGAGKLMACVACEAGMAAEAEPFPTVPTTGDAMVDAMTRDPFHMTLMGPTEEPEIDPDRTLAELRAPRGISLVEATTPGPARDHLLEALDAHVLTGGAVDFPERWQDAADVLAVRFPEQWGPLLAKVADGGELRMASHPGGAGHDWLTPAFAFVEDAPAVVELTYAWDGEAFISATGAPLHRDHLPPLGVEGHPIRFTVLVEPSAPPGLAVAEVDTRNWLLDLGATRVLFEHRPPPATGAET